jgi:hypothetical protein
MVNLLCRARAANLRPKAAPKASNPSSPISGIGLAVFGSSMELFIRRYQRFGGRRGDYFG